MTEITAIDCGIDPGYTDISCGASGESGGGGGESGGGGETPASGYYWFDEGDGFLAISTTNTQFHWTDDDDALELSEDYPVDYIMSLDGDALIVEAA